MASKQDCPLLIRADKKANVGKIIEIWDLCRRMSVKQVNIATTQ
jgi:biopolymer transport protein ExbD